MTLRAVDPGIPAENPGKAARHGGSGGGSPDPSPPLLTPWRPEDSRYGSPIGVGFWDRPFGRVVCKLAIPLGWVIGALVGVALAALALWGLAALKAAV